VRHVLGIDAGGSKTTALCADASGRVAGRARGGGANLRTHGELEVEKVLHRAIEEAQEDAGARAEALALGMAGADRPEDDAVLRGILRRIGFRERVLVTNDARIAFVAGSASGVGLAVVCGTGSIAWGQNAEGAVARAGGWGWRLGDEGSGYWIGMEAMRAALAAADGRGPATLLERALLDHFEIAAPAQILRAVYDGEFPRHRIAALAPRVEAAALAGDEEARRILARAADELTRAAGSVRRKLRLDGEPHDVVLSGGTFAAAPTLAAAVAERLASPGARVARLTGEPADGAVRLALALLS
jgi:N-acetylglucosamine kinase-like BadF-type ATPase